MRAQPEEPINFDPNDRLRLAALDTRDALRKLGSKIRAAGTDSQRLEGIVAKLATGRYEPEATTWVKIKNRTYSQAEGRADFFDIGAACQSR